MGWSNQAVVGLSSTGLGFTTVTSGKQNSGDIPVTIGMESFDETGEDHALVLIAPANDETASLDVVIIGNVTCTGTVSYVAG